VPSLPCRDDDEFDHIIASLRRGNWTVPAILASPSPERGATAI
jgi:hypothetical protein